jgi:hypothetical protein
MVYDYYPFGMLMPGRSLDTAGLCVTTFGVTEIPHYAWVNPGILASTGGGGAVAHGAATLTDQPNDGVAASGTGGGLSYTISGITAYSIQLSTYFSAN